MQKLTCAILILLQFGCSTSPLSSSLNKHPYSIDRTIQLPFPDMPQPSKVTYRQSGTIIRADDQESSDEVFSFLKTFEYLPNSIRQVHTSIENVEKNILKNGKRSRASINKDWQTPTLTVKVDCKTQKILEKLGFQETVDRIEKKFKLGDERDSLIATLVSNVEQAKDICKEVAGPFSISKVAGTLPGHRWIEEVPVDNLETATFNAEFLGWHKDNSKTYAVLYGESKPVAKSGDIPGQVQVETKAYFLIAPRWEKIFKVVTTNIKVFAPGKPPISGTVKIDSKSERIPQ